MANMSYIYCEGGYCSIWRYNKFRKKYLKKGDNMENQDFAKMLETIDHEIEFQEKFGSTFDREDSMTETKKELVDYFKARSDEKLESLKQIREIIVQAQKDSTWL